MKDIAIIGYSGTFPGAGSVDEFTQLLQEGKNMINAITEERLIDTAMPKNIPYSKAGYLENISAFDHSFFGISKGEAEEITPHQRLLLQEAYKTFEHAGFRPKDLKGSDTAVYVGDSSTEYYRMASKASPSLVAGNLKSLNASRISRFFDLRGGAVSIDTACSSTLTAISFACKDLSLRQTDLALVCGVNILVMPPWKEKIVVMGIESETEQCAPFSNKADGTMPGEVVACILLKDLDQAIADQNEIHGVIKGIALNQDGGLSSSITAPSSEAQSHVMAKALKNAGVKASEVGFIEAHGTATKLGDPIEIEGIAQAYTSELPATDKIYLSAVKSNIGHADSAAGIVGVIKLLLSFKENILFPSVNAMPPSKFIDFEAAKVSVVTQPILWDEAKNLEEKLPELALSA